MKKLISTLLFSLFLPVMATVQLAPPSYATVNPGDNSNQTATTQYVDRMVSSASASATGTTQGSAAVLTNAVSVVNNATSGSAQGVVLPSTGITQATVVNNSGATIYVYPPSNQTLNGSSNPLALLAGNALTAFLQNTAWVTPTAGQAATPFSNTSLTNTAVTVKSTAAVLYDYVVTNTGSSVCWLQIFNVPAGSVTLGTTTPVATYGIPAGTPYIDHNFGPYGTTMTGGISIAATSTPTGSAACGTPLTISSIDFQ